MDHLTAMYHCSPTIREDAMMRHLFAATAFLLLSGCERSAVSPDPNAQDRAVIRVTILEGFGTLEPIVTFSRVVRLPGYYDLSAFDSIRVYFTAERQTPGGTGNHILVKVGPMCYKGDSLAATRKDCSILFLPRDLSKPAMCAISFFSPDTGATLLLSRLTVVGWTVP